MDKKMLLLSALVALSACERITPLNRPFPKVVATTLDGREIRPESLTGKPWVINLWVPGCSICKGEFPALEAARKVWEPKGVGFLAISLEPDVQTVSEAALRLGLEMTVATTHDALLDATGARGVPATLFVTAQGRLIGAATGARDQAFFERQAKRLWEDARKSSN